jgi:hypothetical protein
VFAIRLLSADCVKGQFDSLGLTLDAHEADIVSRLAKDSYETLLGNAKSIFNIDFRPSRIDEVVEGLLVRVGKQAGDLAQKQVADFGDWYCRHRDDRDFMPESLWSALMIEFVSQHPNALPPEHVSKIGIDSATELYRQSLRITDRVRDSVKRDLDPTRISEWDKKLVSQTPEMPRQLSDALVTTVDALVFRRFWRAAQLTLTQPDFVALKEWLRDQAAVVAPSAASELDG